MNRRGAALVTALFALLLAGAVGSAALITGQLQWRAGLARQAAAEASLRVNSALERHRVTWDRRFDSMPVGQLVEIGRLDRSDLRQVDSLHRLSARLFQLTSVVEIGPPGGPPLGREGAALLVTLQEPPGPVDGIGSGAATDSTTPVPDRVPGGWWRVD